MDAVKHMLEALELADAYRGFCAPNPAVGAVVVKDGKVVGRGAHKKAGTAHAECEALEADRLFEGATLVVTLEPCCHWGKTPPCTQLIKEKKIARVLYGYRDPNPAVCGKGEAQLREAGIEVRHVPLEPVDRFYESYGYWRKHGRPYVTAKLAMTLDGKITESQGVPTCLTGEEFSRFTHGQRLRADGILSTVHTACADDPQFNARLEDRTVSKKVFLIDRHLKIPRTLRLLETAERLTVFFAEECDEMRVAEVEALGVQAIAVPSNEQGLSLERVADHIGREGIQDLWLESGGKFFQAMVQAGLVQRAYLALAPKWLGHEAYGAFNDGMGRLLDKARVAGWSSYGKDGVCELRWD